jgi:hypothetical protein
MALRFSNITIELNIVIFNFFSINKFTYGTVHRDKSQKLHNFLIPSIS